MPQPARSGGDASLRLARDRGAKLPVPKVTRRRWLGQACRVLGIPAWPQDVMRHTAASMLLARHKDAGRVAHMLGNSARILETNYKQLVNDSDAAAFWAFLPDSPRPVKPKPSSTLKPVVMPADWHVEIDQSMPLFARAEQALTIEPSLRVMGRLRMRSHTGDRIDTIRELGKVAGCSRQTMQFVRVILRHADPDVIDRLRKGKLRIATAYRAVRRVT